MPTVTRQDRVSVIKALAHPTRLQIAELLSGKSLCVTEIQKIVGGDLSTVSKHLTIMRKAGWVTATKTGLQVDYAMTCDCLDDFLNCVDLLATRNPCC